MRTLDQWLNEYGESHRHPLNKAIHWLCTPVIMVSTLGLLSQVPDPVVQPFVHAGSLVGLLALLYYLMLSPRLTLGMALVLALILWAVEGLGALPWPPWASCVVLFAAAWVVQFVGHAIEGKRPSFMKDLQFLLIGPLWLLAALYRGLGIKT